MQLDIQETIKENEKEGQLRRIDVFTFCFCGLTREVIKNPSARDNLNLSLKTMGIAHDKLPKIMWETGRSKSTPLVTFDDIRQCVPIDD